MDDLFSIGFWNQSTKPTGLDLCQVNSIECIHPVGENLSLFSIGGTLPQAANLPQFPADKAFVERAARSSSLSDSSIGDMMSHFQSTIICANASTNAEFEAQTEKNKKHKDNFYGLGAAKRKRNNEDMALDQAQVTSYVTGKMEEDKMEFEQNAKPSSPSVATDKLRGKQTTDSIESSNDEFIHIRARRGQATNSHSLAERVRREKINERMKLLQNLVPGCSKITGKAVMLDEIINYVQSLQQQVEFLSMKLAAINPSLDIDIDSVLSKYSFNGMVNPPDSLGRSIDTQIAALYGYKESRLQMAHSNNVNLNAHGLQQ